MRYKQYGLQLLRTEEPSYHLLSIMSLSTAHSKFLFLGLLPLVFITIATVLVQAWHHVVSCPEYLPDT